MLQISIFGRTLELLRGVWIVCHTINMLWYVCEGCSAHTITYILRLPGIPVAGIDCAICACASQNRCGVAVGLSEDSFSESICTMSCICTSCTVLCAKAESCRRAGTEAARFYKARRRGQAWAVQNISAGTATVPCTRTARTTNIALRNKPVNVTVHAYAHMHMY